MAEGTLRFLILETPEPEREPEPEPEPEAGTAIVRKEHFRADPGDQTRLAASGRNQSNRWTNDGLGAQLRAIRLERGFTLEQLAEASGVSVRGISDIERGVRSRPRRATLDALCSGLDLDQATRRDVARRLLARERFENSMGAVQPHRFQDFVGRENEYRIISKYLSRPLSNYTGRTVVISGAPGVGKTALALEATQRLREPDALPLYLDLLGPSPALGRSPVSVLQSLLRQVLDPDEGPPPSSLDAAAAMWRAKCANHELTVVLDNVAEEAQVRPVLAGGNLRAVITSRRSLCGLEGVGRLRLKPFSRAESVRLLRQVIPAGQRTDEDVVELARLCGDLPLALRIVANRVASQATRTAAEFAGRLRLDDQRPRVLVAGDLSAVAAFRLSYDELDAFSSGVFRSLSLLQSGSFDVKLVSVLTGAEELDVEESLDELVELGLVEFLGSSRYRLHDLLRAFATEELRREDGESARNAKASYGAGSSLTD
jgi:transcriptional regulator with XRE-family HTH domain